MLTLKGDVKLVDFATMHDGALDQDLTHTFVGTPMYMAPEIWAGSAKAYNVAKVDVWSMGVILCELVCGKVRRPSSRPRKHSRARAQVPFQGETPDQYLKSILATATKELELPGHLSAELRDVLKRALQINPTLRITWDELVGHRWLAQESSLAATARASGLPANVDAVLRLELQVAELEAKCKQQTELAAHKDKIIASLTQEIAAGKLVDADAEAKNRRLLKLQESFYAASEEAGRVRSQHEQLLQREQDTARALDQLRVEHAGQSTRLASTEQQIQRLQAELVAGADALHAAEQLVQQLQAEKLAEAEAREQQLQRVQADKAADTAAMQQQVQQLRAAHATETAALRQQAQQLQAAQAKLEHELQALHQDATAETATLRQQVQQMQALADELAQQGEQRRSGLDADLARQTAAAAALEASLAKAKSELAAAQAESALGVTVCCVALAGTLK